MTFTITSAHPGDLTLPCGVTVPAGGEATITLDQAQSFAGNPVVEFWFKTDMLSVMSSSMDGGDAFLDDQRFARLPVLGEDGAPVETPPEPDTPLAAALDVDLMKVNTDLDANLPVPPVVDPIVGDVVSHVDPVIETVLAPVVPPVAETVIAPVADVVLPPVADRPPVVPPATLAPEASIAAAIKPVVKRTRG